MNESKNSARKSIKESKKSAKKSLKEEKVTDSLFTDVGFFMIKKFKLKKEYDVERPSWTVFNFKHKNKDAQFAITFDERGHGDFLYGDVLAFGDEKDDIFKYKTDEVKVDSYNIEKECSNIIADCLAFIDSNKKITIFELKKSARKSIKESRKSILDERFYELVDEGYIYDEDEDGMNMSYGELVAISDDLWETLENELKYYDDFQEAYDVYMDIMDNTSDDAKMFMTGSDEYFYFEADEDEGTYSVDGEVPFVLEKLFKQFQKNTDLVRK